MEAVITLADALMRLIRILCVQNIAATGNMYQDIVYKSASDLWACCSTPSRGRNCSDPDSETFQAPPLDQLKRVSSSSISLLSTSASLASTSTSFTPTSTSLPSKISSMTAAATTVTVTSQPTGRNDPSLGSGAKVGIVAGAVIGGFIIFAGVVFFVRRSKRGKPVVGGPDRAADQSTHIFTGGQTELGSTARAELDARVRAELNLRAQAELDTENNRAELL
ncbi:hypothetical protein MMC22_000307 [Lobaria immixta]|nr:hypothetical protein [Lobaria immixta]